MNQRSILLIFCLSLVPILLNAAAESPPRSRVHRIKQMEKRENISPRDEDKKVVTLILPLLGRSGVAEDSKKEEKLTKKELADIQELLRFHAKALGKAGSKRVCPKKRRSSIAASEICSGEAAKKTSLLGLTRNKSSSASHRLPPHIDLSNVFRSESPRAKQRPQSELGVASPRQFDGKS